MPCGSRSCQRKPPADSWAWDKRHYSSHNVLSQYYGALQCTVQCTMYNLQCTMHNVQCTMYNVQCTMYCALHYNEQYNVQCTMYTLHKYTAVCSGVTLLWLWCNSSVWCNLFPYKHYGHHQPRDWFWILSTDRFAAVRITFLQSLGWIYSNIQISLSEPQGSDRRVTNLSLRRVAQHMGDHLYTNDSQFT